LSGEQFPEVRVAPCQTILEVKGALAPAAGAPAKYIRLLSQQGELANRRTVAEEDLPEVVTLNLIRCAPKMKTFMGILEDEPLMVKLLLDCMANPNERDELGWTALHWASYREHLAVAAALIVLPEFALINAEDVGHMTVLHFCAKHGQTSLVQMIVDNPDFNKFNAISANGNSALHWAARNGHGATCKVLLDLTCFTSVNSQNDAGWTALHYASAAGLVQVCKQLIRHPRFATLNALTNNGETALDWAVKNGYHDICEVLTAGHQDDKC